MSNIYFTVGPSQTYATVPAHVEEGLKNDIFSLNHRGSSFSEIYAGVDEKLKKLLSIPQDYSIFFLSSGTEGMERVIENTVENTSFHIVTGTFGDRFYHAAQELGKTALSHEFDPLKGFDARAVQVPENAELIAFTHNDTSTGMQIPLEEIYAIGAQNPEALIAIDTVSSVPYVDIDYTKVDAVFFSVQKGFGMPAGLGVLIVSPRAIEKAQNLFDKGVSIGSYHNFLSLSKYAKKHQTPDTPNVLGIYLLDRVLSDFLEIGISTIREQTEQKATMLYDFFATSEKFTPLVRDEKHQSRTTLVIEVAGGSAEIQKELKQQGIIIGSGYGEHKNDHIRIANFPAHSVDDIRRLINSLQTL